jgi:hypothetical protein
MFVYAKPGISKNEAFLYTVDGSFHICVGILSDSEKGLCLLLKIKNHPAI